MHTVLLIAEKQTLGSCLEEVFLEDGCSVTTVESYDEFSHVFQDGACTKFDLVIATNTCLPPVHLQTIVPYIKARHPHARIIVLSGYCAQDFVAELKQKGMDGFLPLPFEEDALVDEVSGPLLHVK